MVTWRFKPLNKKQNDISKNFLTGFWLDIILSCTVFFDIYIHLFADWEYSQGFINAEMIQEHLPPPSDDSMILMCGPPPMIQFACIPNLDKLGYRQSQRFVY